MAGERDEPPARLTQLLRAHANAGAEAATVGALGDEELGYREFWNCVTKRAGWLVERGVRAGDRVALEVACTTAVMVASVAVLACGAVLVPLGVYGGAGSQDRLRALAALRASGARWYLSAGAPVAAPHEAHAAGLRPEYLSLADVPGDVLRPLPPEPAADAPALIQFSSGSLAAPRGIVLTHGNLAANLSALALRHGRASDSRCVSWLPLSHDFGLIGCFWGCLYPGAAFRAMAPSAFVRDPLAWIEQLSAFRATHAGAPPFGYEMAAGRAERARDRLAGIDLSALSVAVVGAERIVPSLCERFEEVFAPYGLRRHVLLPAYGLAENCVAAASRSPLVPSVVGRFDVAALERGRLQPVSAGHAPGQVRELIGHGGPLSGTDVRIVAPDGRPVPDGWVGEIRIGGASTARHIVGPDGTAHPAAGTDGLVPTGDLGAVRDGELYVIGRMKETLKHSGRLLAPADVEQSVLDAAPNDLGTVAAVAVARPDAVTEELVLFLELSAVRRAAVGPSEEAELARAARLAVLREFRVPVSEIYVARRGALPRTTSGKVQRLGLGAAVLAGKLPPGVTPAGTVPVPRPGGVPR
ncbi:AMP-binding protein [Streptomyces lavendulae]|uniref:AMP-binding protein n=1 Tax=Streptomyces lavendulae TaxID=1914 RepID=UPI0031F068F9